MKKDTHPPYQEVLFVDSSTGNKFVIGSTLQCDQTETYEGKEYPVQHVSVSSDSHPFYTGSKQFIDTEGRVDKFMKRYGGGSQAGKKDSKKDQDSSSDDGAAKDKAAKKKS